MTHPTVPEEQRMQIDLDAIERMLYAELTGSEREKALRHLTAVRAKCREREKLIAEAQPYRKAMEAKLAAANERIKHLEMFGNTLPFKDQS